MMSKCKYLILLMLLCFFSCGEEPEKSVVVPKDQMKNSMEKANRGSNFKTLWILINGLKC